jgi:uncharacterized protein DUF6627
MSPHTLWPGFLELKTNTKRRKPLNAFNRLMARMLIVCSLGVSLPLPASASLVTTDQSYASAERDQVKNFLDRAELRTQIQALGVDAGAVRARVDALTDEEVAALAGRIDQLPAGGSDVLGVLLAVFIILLITDILGLTRVFPFTRAVR